MCMSDQRVHLPLIDTVFVLLYEWSGVCEVVRSLLCGLCVWVWVFLCIFMSLRGLCLVMLSNFFLNIFKKGVGMLRSLVSRYCLSF